ncbi:MAG: hypothetical protein H7Z43_15910 [Clostridia bacterium]|nr:hypothetical protein [Deltaproteobacteria bacterium]
MKWLLRIAIGLVVAIAALPFVVLSATGIMRPTEGFCVENVALTETVHAPTVDEQEQSFFVSPELADPTIRVPVDPLLGFDPGEGVNWRWPICSRTRHAEHQIVVGYYNWQLMKLGEPNLRYAARTSAVYRIVTAPSFSRVPIALRLEVPATSAEGTLHSTWLEEDGTKPDPSKTTPESDRAWWEATLPKRSMQRKLDAQRTKALQTLFEDLPPHQSFNLDGIGLAIESVRDGRRDVRAAFLFSPPHPTGRLFCAVAKQSGIPKQVLIDGDVDICGD